MPFPFLAASFGLSALGFGLSIFGSSRAKKEAKRTQAEQVAFDARSAKLSSEALLEEAALEATEIRRGGVLLGKKQRALTAKAGLKIGTGTAEDIQRETAFLTQKDVSTVLESAERESTRLLKTFEVGGQELVSQEDAERLRDLRGSEEEQRSALEGLGFSNSNFIRSTRNNSTFFTGL